jgi:hypothetical protein
MIRYWLDHAQLSYEQFLAIVDWGMNERGFLDKGTLSRLRAGFRSRGASWRHLDAMAAANHAIWLWQIEGQQKAWVKLGPPGAWGVQDEWLNKAFWLPHPDRPNEPLEFADMAKVLTGYIDLPYLAPMIDDLQASNALTKLLERICTEHGWGALTGVRKLLNAYPAAGRDRQQWLMKIITGEQVLSPNELELELSALAEMIRVVKGLNPGSYGSTELRAELASDHPGK